MLESKRNGVYYFLTVRQRTRSSLRVRVLSFFDFVEYLSTEPHNNTPGHTMSTFSFTLYGPAVRPPTVPRYSEPVYVTYRVLHHRLTAPHKACALYSNNNSNNSNNTNNTEERIFTVYAHARTHAPDERDRLNTARVSGV